MPSSLRYIDLLKRNFNLVCSSFIKCRKMSHAQIVYVRQFDNDDTMKISFLYGSNDSSVQNYTFMRSKSEPLEVALARIKCKIQTAILKKNSKKWKKVVVDVDQVLPPLDISLVKNGIKLDVKSKNEDAWTAENKLCINEDCFHIVINPPSVAQISLPKCILSGFFVYPNVTLEFSSVEDSLFKWYRKVEKIKSDGNKEENIVKMKNEFWKCISEGFLYNVEESDIGYKLRVTCLPQLEDKSGIEEAAVSLNNVTAGPKNCPFEDRHQFTKEKTDPGSYRFVSYNILADLYADTETARKELFPYCPVECLDIHYRKHLYIKEIIGYNADILCMQEVDRRVFHEDLVPVLRTIGLKGVFNEKGGQVAEGLSCFYRDTKFKLVESHSIILSEAIKSEAVLHSLHEKISENEALLERFMSRTTALQITLLENLDVPDKRILVGNTHLYFHPDSDNIRLLQATCCLLYLEHMLKKYREQDPSYTTSLIFCGDFNSCPEFGVYKLATEGFLTKSCIDWHSNPAEKVDGVDLIHSLQLSSACGTPEYTNFTEGFVGCLDYIFYDRRFLEATQVVPLPPHEQVIKHVALPNQVFPSDHLALVSVLKWK